MFLLKVRKIVLSFSYMLCFVLEDVIEHSKNMTLGSCYEVEKQLIEVNS